MSTIPERYRSLFDRYRASSDLYVEDSLQAIRDRHWLRIVLFFGPASTLMFCFLVLPLVYMVVVSFSTAFPPEGFTLENYRRIVETDAYVSVIYRTVGLTVQTTVIVLALGYAVAYTMAMFARRVKLLLFLVILPFWVNYLVRNFSLFAIFQNGGAFHQLTGLIWFADFSPNLLYSRTMVLFGLVYSFLPVAILPMYASIARLDESLIMAAKDLGAGPIKTFLFVTLPLTKDGIFVAILLVMIPTFGAFVTPAMLGGSSETMIGSLIELQYMSVYDVPFGSAIGTFTATFVLVMLIASTKISGIPMLDTDEN